VVKGVANSNLASPRVKVLVRAVSPTARGTSVRRARRRSGLVGGATTKPNGNKSQVGVQAGSAPVLAHELDLRDC
jgi:hypothetical protein